MKNKDMGEACSMDGGKERGYSVLVGKPDGKRPLGRPRCRWEDDIEMDLKAVGRAWSLLMWIRMGRGTGARELGWTFGFHKIRGIS
jgi:hypothetical protein